MSMPGTPIVYYGDEIGMGDNIYLGDRNGVRTPMQWNSAANAGFSSADPEASVRACDFKSGLWLSSGQRGCARAVRAFAAFLDEVSDPGAECVPGIQSGIHAVSEPVQPPCAGVHTEFGHEIVLVVNNLSNSAQAVELDVQRYKGYVPIEMFGRSLFPRFGNLPYLLTLGPYQFYWFQLRRI